jgi:hypothetical protein
MFKPAIAGKAAQVQPAMAGQAAQRPTLNAQRPTLNERRSNHNPAPAHDPDQCGVNLGEWVSFKL